MRTLPLLTTLCAALLAACVHVEDPPPYDLRLLAQHPVIGIEQLPPSRAQMEFRSNNLIQAVTAVSTAITTNAIQKPFAPSGTVPQLTGDWVRAPLPPAEGPLFDPTDVLAAAVLGRMQSDQLVDPASRVCTQPEDCKNVGMVLRLRLAGVGFSNSSVDFDPRMRFFNGAATLVRSDGRVLWEGTCSADVQDVSNTVNASTPVGRPAAERLQAMVDRGAWQCGDALALLLERNVGWAPR